MVFLRKVKTASGATAVQIARKENRRDVVVEHVGSAHTDAELAALMQVGRRKIEEGQGVLDLGLGQVRDPRAAVVQAQSSRLLVDTIGARSLGDSDNLLKALNVVGCAQASLHDDAGARQTLQEAIDIARTSDNSSRLMFCLGDMGNLQAYRYGRYDEALKLYEETAAIAGRLGDEGCSAHAALSIADCLTQAGRAREAVAMMPDVVAAVLRLRDPRLLVACLNTYSYICAEFDPGLAARVLGSEDEMRVRIGLPRDGLVQALHEERLAKATSALPAVEWEHHYAQGRITDPADVLLDKPEISS